MTLIESRNDTSVSLARLVGTLLAMLLITVTVYWPSLGGGFVFDDFPNILGNPAVQLTALDWASIKEAALGSPSGILIRPLAMLSFGIDWYLSGGPDPWRMKAENLFIHLYNGLALFGLMRAILRNANMDRQRGDLIVLGVTAAWLLAPINFTAVAYVVQRMESLCQVFVLGGLWGYVAARERMLHDGSGLFAAALSLVVGTGLGALAKESAVLLPIYALAVELCLFDFRRKDGKRDRTIVAMYTLLLVLPAIVGAIFVAPRFFAPNAYAERAFTLTERLLTEPRILFHYLGWTLLPNPRHLALYHDDIAISRDLMSPWTTLPCALTLLAILPAAMAVRKRYSLLALGTFWFLAAHLLTATIIPLELTFEHRNYFASIGVLLVAFTLLLPQSSISPLRRARSFACFAMLGLFALTTFARALEWGTPVSFALAESRKNPNSARAAYELGRIYVVASRYQADSPVIPLAYSTLEHAATMPRASILPDQALLILDSHLGRESASAVWSRMQYKLAHGPLSPEDKWSLYSLSECAAAGECTLSRNDMVATFNAALHTPPDAGILSIYANYALTVLQDTELAIRLTRDAADIAKDNLRLYSNLIVLLLTNKQESEARQLLEETLRRFPRALRDPVYQALIDELIKKHENAEIIP